MFRQILVHKDHRKFQRILWRFDANEEVKLWSLKTVTYGMVSSPYLAIRVIRQLALDEGKKFPLAVDILNKETYMDDTLSGGHSLDEAFEKQRQLIEICKVSGFELHKWKANNISLLNFPKADCAATDASNSYFDVLGIQWSFEGDFFSLNFSLNQIKYKLTKEMFYQV